MITFKTLFEERYNHNYTSDEPAFISHWEIKETNLCQLVVKYFSRLELLTPRKDEEEQARGNTQWQHL